LWADSVTLNNNSAQLLLKPGLANAIHQHGWHSPYPLRWRRGDVRLYAPTRPLPTHVYVMDRWTLPPRGARQAASLFAASGALGVIVALVPSSIGHRHLAAAVAANATLVVVGTAAWLCSGTRQLRRAGVVLFPLLGFLTIALTNLWGSVPPVMLGSWFLLVTIWTGLWLPRGAALVEAPFVTAAYVLPLLAGAPRSQGDLASAMFVIPIAVIAGEVVAAGAAETRRLEAAQRRLIDEREAARAAIALRERYYRALVERINDYVLVLGPDIRPRYATEPLLDLVGLTLEELADADGMPTFVEPDDLPGIAAAIERALAEPLVPMRAEVHVRGRDGASHYCVGMTTNLLDDPAVGGIVVVLHDLTDNKALEDQLRHQALHDLLTGLPNRALLADRLAQMAARSKRRNRSCAVMYIDLDNFKHINDSLGHDVGDTLLVEVAQRLDSVLRDGDTVGRLGGDEFVVLAEETSEPLRAELLAERVLDVLAAPFTVDGGRRRVTVSASIGIAEGVGLDPDRILRNADVALYRAKATGRHSYVVFKPEMYQEIEDRLSLEIDLHGSLDRSEFFLLYQPVVDLRTLETTGVEALLRWRHPVRGVVGPETFVPLLEETGLIADVGRWVLETACRQGAEWNAMGFALSVSVNVSARQLEDDFAGIVRGTLEASGLDPARLILEITETVLLRNSGGVIEQLTALHRAGVRIAIDDFGTGYSSMSYLRKFPIDILKIDRSFVAGLHDGQKATTLVRTLVGLGQRLGLETIAEGIEDMAQLAELRGDLCSDGQGYLFARPLAASDVERFGRRGALAAVTASRAAPATASPAAAVTEQLTGSAESLAL